MEQSGINDSPNTNEKLDGNVAVVPNSFDPLSSSAEESQYQSDATDFETDPSLHSWADDADGNNRGDDDADNENSDDETTMSFTDDDDDDDREDVYGNPTKGDFSSGVPPGSFDVFAVNGRDAIERKEYQRKVLRRILMTFDLENVKDRYRGGSLKRSLSHADRRFRQWLQSAMGNDKVDLCDKKWHERFRQKVMEEYERQQTVRERQLAEAEVQRVHKLRLQGTLRGDGEENEGGKHSKRRGKKKSGAYLEDFNSKHQTLYAHPNDDVETQMQGIKTASEQQRSDDERDDVSETKTQQEDGENGEVEERNGRVANDDLEEENQDQTKGRRSSETSGLGDNNIDSSLGIKGQLGRVGSTDHETHSDLQRLYDQEDLRALYAEAESLVRMTLKK